MNKFLLLIAVLLAAVFLMFKFLPWWVGVICIVGAVFGLTWIVPLVLRRAFMAPFKLKSKTLSGAQITLHDVSTAAPPEFDAEEFDDDDYSKEELQHLHEDVAQFNWHKLDVTITPAPATDGFTHWEPGELQLVGPDATSDDLDDPDDEDNLCRIDDYKIFQDGKFCETEMDKYTGPQRLELYAGIKPNVQTLQFRYYFALFGRISLSDSAG
jgi:hypothetical protein